jgi:hypothetical protein
MEQIDIVACCSILQGCLLPLLGFYLLILVVRVRVLDLSLVIMVRDFKYLIFLDIHIWKIHMFE